jgi:hypothetical protein
MNAELPSGQRDVAAAVGENALNVFPFRTSKRRDFVMSPG